MVTGIKPFWRLLRRLLLTVVPHKDLRHNLLAKRLVLGVLLVLALGAVFYTRAGAPTRVYAAPADSLNFQARLKSSAGAIVADGNYSISFNLYNDPTTGTTQWTETQTVAVKSGYLSVYLGTTNAFPGTIDWSQAQYLTMNVNGDGEMNPRLKLTAVPFAFRAAQADTLTITGGSITGDNLAQLAPTGLQVINSTFAGLRINQTGSGGLLQLATGGSDQFTISNGGDGTLAGDFTISGGGLDIGTASQAGAVTLRDGGGGSSGIAASPSGLTLTTGGNVMIGASDATGTLFVLDDKTSATDPAGVNGAMYYNSNMDRFRCFQNGQWQDCINGANNNSTASFVSGLANVPANTTGTAAEMLVFTSATGVSNTAGVTGFTAPAAGSFRTCLVKNNALLTAGSVSLRWRVNGVSVGVAACTLNTTKTRESASSLDPGVVTFNAGDTIGIAYDSVGLAPTTTEYTAYWTIEYNATNAASNQATLQSAYSASTTPELILDSTRGGLTIRDNAAPIGGNLLEIQDALGATTYLGVTASGITSANTLTISSGGLNNSTGGITNAGSITGVGADITGSGALTLASGGAGALTLDSASNTMIIAANDTTLQRNAAGSYTIDLADTANTGLTLTNSDGTALAGMTIEGSLSVGSGTLSINSSGDVTSAFTLLDGATTTNGTSGAGTSTALIVTNAANFDIGNYVQISAANCGGTGVNPCYAKITNKVANTLTIAPALRWTNGVTVNEYHVPELGGTDTAQPLSGRFGRGYFIAGVATGNGTTNYDEDSISTSLSSFDLLNTGVATLNIGGAATTINLGTASTTVDIAGGLNVGGTTLIGTGGDLTNIGDITGAAGMTISSGGTGALTLDSASNTLVIAGSDTGLSRTAAGSYTIDLIDTGATSLRLTNSGTGTASLNLVDGDLQLNGATVLSSGAVLSNLTGISSSGTVSLAGLSGGGIVRAANGTGDLSIATGGTDYELPLTFGNGLTRTTNDVALGGNLTAATAIGLNGNALTITGSGSSVFTAFAAGGIDVRADAAAAFAVRNAAGTTSYLTVNTTGNLVQVGSATTDAVAILKVLDKYNNATDPTAVDGASYYNSARNEARCSDGNRGFTSCLGVTKPNTRRTASFMAPGGTGTTFSVSGDTFATAGTAVAATTTAPAMLQYTTTAVTNNTTSIAGNTNYNSSANPSMQTHLVVPTITTSRVWAGLTNQTAAVMGASANPAGSYAAFRYDTSAGDTTWRCVTKNGTTQSIGNSLVTVTAGVSYELEIVESATNVVFKINDSVVCTNTTNLPAANTLMRENISMTTLAASARQIRVAWIYLDSDR